MTETLKILINGTENKDLYLDLLEMIVDTNIHLPSMFSLLIQDDLDSNTGKFKYIDSEIFIVGASIKIDFDTDYQGYSETKSTLFNGEITGVEPIFNSDGLAMLRVRGYDKSHRLTRGKKTRTFLDMKDSDIFSNVASDCGLSVQVDATTTKYNYVIQYNQSDWDFLWSRAMRIGYKIFCDDQKIYFSKIDKQLGSQLDLTWGLDLRKFEPRISISGQIDESVTIGWDAKQKTSIEGKETGNVNVVPSIGFGQSSGGAFAKSKISSASNYIANTRVIDASDAKNLATGQKILSESSFIQAEGECSTGNPKLIAGIKVNVDGVGTKFSGTYHVTEARHFYSMGNYTVTFSVTGQNPNTIYSLISGDNNGTSNKIEGVVPAIVTQNEKDPDGLNRIQVKFPWLPKNNGAEVSSAWARVATINGGKDRGIYFMPEIDDEVLVAFEHGDINYPYIVGSLWNGKDTTPIAVTEAIKSGKVNQRVIKSRSGHIITMDDTDGSEKISIVDKTLKNSIVINSKDNSMTIKAEGDLIFDAGGKFTVSSKGDVIFDSKAKATIKASSEFSVTANSKASIKSGPGELALQASGTALKGTTVEVNGSAKTDVKSGAMVQIQGAMVKIN